MMRKEMFEDIVNIVKEINDEVWFVSDGNRFKTVVIDPPHVTGVSLIVDGDYFGIPDNKVIDVENAERMIKALKKMRFDNYNVSGDDRTDYSLIEFFDAEGLIGRMRLSDAHRDLFEAPPVDMSAFPPVKVDVNGYAPILKKKDSAILLPFKKTDVKEDEVELLRYGYVGEPFDNGHMEKVDLGSGVAYEAEEKADIWMDVDYFNTLTRLAKIMGGMSGKMYIDSVHYFDGKKEYVDGTTLKLRYYVAPMMGD